MPTERCTSQRKRFISLETLLGQRLTLVVPNDYRLAL